MIGIKKSVWVYCGKENGLMKYKCSNCGYTKLVMHTNPKQTSTKCPSCGADISYE